MLTAAKTALFGQEAKARTVPLGLYHGLKMQLDLRCQLQLFLGLAERETHSWIRNQGHDAGSAIDVGAGDGELVMYLLRRTAARRVFAFEPSQPGRDKIGGNLALNHLTHCRRVSVSAKCVGSRDDNDFCTLDSLLAQLDPPVFIKIDVDGAEVDVLRGATKLLQSPGSRWLVETHSPRLEEDCLEVFDQFGYKTRIVPNAWYRMMIPEFRPIRSRWLVAQR